MRKKSFTYSNERIIHAKTSMADWVEYFSNQTAPANLKETKTAVTEFTASHRAAGRNIVLITVSVSLLCGFYCCNWEPGA